MSNKLPDNLVTTHWGMKFSDPGVEANYRVWRISESLPLMKVGAFIGLFSWLATTYTLYTWAPEHYEKIVFSIWAVAIPVITACTLTLAFIPPNSFCVYILIIMLNTSGFVSFWQGSVITGYPGMGLVWALLTAMFAAFARLPPSKALIGSGPYILYAIFFTSESYSAGNLSNYEFHTYTSGPLMGLSFILVLCIFFERLMRQNYSNQQQMALQHESLQSSSELIRRYVPPALADQIYSGQATASDTPQRKRVTVLFSDIVDFTRIADRVEAEAITEVINDYMSTMSNIIDEHRGTLNEFIGDGLMALFGAPDHLEPEEQAARAIHAAQAMQAEMPGLNKRWRKLGLGEEVQIRIGINTGVLSVGSFGSEGRMTYTAIGLQTNIAARIQSHCKPGSILISDATFALVEDDVECEPKGEVECKGVHFPVKVYEPKINI